MITEEVLNTTSPLSMVPSSAVCIPHDIFQHCSKLLHCIVFSDVQLRHLVITFYSTSVSEIDDILCKIPDAKYASLSKSSEHKKSSNHFVLPLHLYETDVYFHLHHKWTCTDEIILFTYKRESFVQSVFLEMINDGGKMLPNLEYLQQSLQHTDKYIPVQQSKYWCYCHVEDVIMSISNVVGILNVRFSQFANNCSPILDRCVSSYPMKITYVAFEMQKCVSEINQFLQPSLSLQSHRRDTIRKNHIAWRRFGEIIIGIMIFLWINNGDNSAMCSSEIMMFAKNRVSELSQLLHWMMGYPAGLKLNKQLDEFLGKFFLYHIFLWTAYLQILEPVMSTLVWLMSLFGCLGVSLLIALIQDMISMMTLHIYCLYVYAARLFHIEMLALSALWRLFRGKKWNTLRKRVDSAQHNVDKLVGTLLFIILLFLWPTVALYYVVFLMLRLLVISSQSIIATLLNLFSKCSPYFWWLKSMQADCIKGPVKLNVQGLLNGSVLHCQLELQLLEYSALLNTFRHAPKAVTERTNYSAKKLFQMVVWGELIYPWISKK